MHDWSELVGRVVGLYQTRGQGRPIRAIWFQKEPNSLPSRHGDVIMFAGERSVAVALIMASVLLASSAAFGQARVTWPEGWDNDVRTRQNREQDGSSATSFQQTGVKKGPSGLTRGIILVFSLLRDRSLPVPDLTTEADQMKKEAILRSSRPGSKTECGELTPATVTGIPALRMSCSVLQDGQPEVKQTISVLVKDRHIVCLIYTAPKDLYDLLKPEYDAVEASLKL